MNDRTAPQPLSTAITGAWFAAIVALGVALRWLSLNNRSFWLDETTAVRQAQWSIPEMLRRMSDNVHPPLFHTLLHYWIRSVGSSEVAVRCFALAWGILAIGLTFWAAAAIYDRRTALLASAIVAISPFFIWYSQEARMYTMMLCFSLLALGSMWKAMETGRTRWWILYALSIAAGIMTQYFFGFLVIAQGLYFLFGHVRSRVRSLRDSGTARTRLTSPWGVFHDAPQLWGWLGSLAVMALPLAWWVPQVVVHRDLFRGVSGPFNYGWSPPAFGPHFNEQILVPVEWLFGFHTTAVMRGLVAMWPLAITGAFVLGGMARTVSDKTRYVLTAGVGGAAMISLLGFWQPILEARYFTAVGIPLVIAAGKLLSGLRRRSLLPMLAVMVAVSAVCWTDQAYNPDSIIKWDNRSAMGIVADGYRPGDAVLLLPYFVTSITQYYLPPDIYAVVEPLPSFDKRGRVRNTRPQLAADLERKVGGARRVWVIATWQETPRIALDRANVGDWLAENDYRLVTDHRLRQIRVTLYETTPAPPEPFFQPEGQNP